MTKEVEVTGYLANQFGFSETGLWLLNDLIKPGLERIGINILEPFTEVGKVIDFSSLDSLKYHEERKSRLRGFSERIGPINDKLMQKSDCLLALLDGGPAVDDGVAGEIGYYAGIKRGPIFALRSDFRCGENMSVSINPQLLGYILGSRGELYEPPKAIDRWFERISAFKEEMQHSKKV